jgi:hypothetical protein
VRDAGGLDHPGRLQLDLPAARVLEQADAAAEEQGRDVDLDLVEQARPQALLRDARASGNADILAPGGRPRLRTALSMPSVTKVNVVPRSLASGSRSACVTTKTGLWNGGPSPHPCALSNIRLPSTTAPEAFKPSSTTSELEFVSPPSRPWGSRQAASRTTHS